MSMDWAADQLACLDSALPHLSLPLAMVTYAVQGECCELRVSMNTLQKRSTTDLEMLDAAARHDLLEILEDRYGRRSTIVTRQLPVNQWHALIGDPTYADAVLDRLVHNAHRIDLKGGEHAANP